MTILPFQQIRMTCRAKLSTGQIVEVSQIVDEQIMGMNPEWKAEAERQLRMALIEQIVKHAPPVVHYER